MVQLSFGYEENSKELHKEYVIKYPQHYRRWKSMNQRCYNSNSTNYKHYGKRGIGVCIQWRSRNMGGHSNFVDFVKCLESLPKPEGKNLSIDRIDNNDDYRPGNIRWATPTQQAHNRNANIIIKSPYSKERQLIRSLSPVNRQKYFKYGMYLDPNIPAGRDLNRYGIVYGNILYGHFYRVQRVINIPMEDLQYLLDNGGDKYVKYLNDLPLEEDPLNEVIEGLALHIKCKLKNYKNA